VIYDCEVIEGSQTADADGQESAKTSSTVVMRRYDVGLSLASVSDVMWAELASDKFLANTKILLIRSVTAADTLIRSEDRYDRPKREEIPTWARGIP